MRKWLLLAIALPFGIPAPLSAQLSASPAMVWLDGAATTATITVRNEDQEPRQVRVYAADFDQSAAGENEFFEVGTQAGSCGARLRVTPDVAVLAAGESRELRLEMTDPSDPCWAVVFVQTSSAAPGGISVAQRIGVKVFAGNGGPATLNAEITAVEARPARGGIAVAFEFRNSSPSAVHPSGSVQLRTATGESIAEVAVEPFSVLPGRTRRIEAFIPAAPPAGRYVVVPVLDFGGDYLAGGQGLLRSE